MSKEEILHELFSASPEMEAHLLAGDNCSDQAVLKSIGGALLPLQRKLELLKEYQPYISGDNKEWEERRKEDCRQMIFAAEEAIKALKATPGNIFMWKNRWHDDEWPHDIGEGDSHPCLSMDEVLATIQAEINEDNACFGMTEEDEVYPGWYEVEKWAQRVDDNGVPHLEETPWHFIIADRQVCFFRHNSCRHRSADTYGYSQFEDSSDLNLSIPFEHGDIVTVDCRPFTDIIHAMLVEVSMDCCGVQAAFVDKYGKLQIAPLKHSHCFTKNYISKLSPLYRLTRFTGEPDEREKILKYISQNIKQENKEDRDRFGYGMWCGIRYCRD